MIGKLLRSVLSAFVRQTRRYPSIETYIKIIPVCNLAMFGINKDPVEARDSGYGLRQCGPRQAIITQSISNHEE